MFLINAADFELRFVESEAQLFNVFFDTRPLVIHGNGPSKRHLNHLGNYIPKAWNQVDQCTACWEDTLTFDQLPETPQVVVGAFIAAPTPFLDEFFEKLANLDYPRDKIDLFIYVGDAYHTSHVESFLATDAAKKFHSLRVLDAEKDDLTEAGARARGLELCAETKCDYYFNVDSTVHLDNAEALKLLIEQNRKVIAPMLLRPGKAWSNFWGALGSDGFYARSSDYMEIVQYKRLGVWNVPFISSCYLIHGSLIHDEAKRPGFQHPELDPGPKSLP